MHKTHIKTIIASCIALATLACHQNSGESKDTPAYDSVLTVRQSADTHTILSEIKASADIVTTEVKIRKIAIYDSSKSERFQWRDPSTWKFGTKKCIIPVTVTIKYGYDLSQLNIDDIKLTDDSTAVILLLPKPKIIDAGYEAEIEKGSITSISTGMRSRIGHELEEEIRQKGYEAVLKEDLQGIIGKEIENNAKTLFESIIKSLGWNYVQIVTVEK